MVNICRILKSRFLVLETPASLNFSSQKIESIGDFFRSINPKGIRMVWEVRRPSGEHIPPDLATTMQDYNIVHCADLSKEDPTVDSDTVYTRVFGKGEHNLHQFTDEEIMDRDKKITSRNPSGLSK